MRKIEHLAKQTILLSFAVLSLERDLATLPLKREHYQNIKRTSFILKQKELNLTEFLHNRNIRIQNIRAKKEAISYTIEIDSISYDQIAMLHILQYESKLLIEQAMFRLVY